MIFFILFSILFSQNTDKYVVNSKMDTFYDISSMFLYPINMEEDEIVFYGTGGGVLRTYDNGQNWKQNFSGTHALIWKMIYHNELLFAINLDGRFMLSEDKGDYWKIYKVTDTLTSIAVLDEKIFTTSDRNIFISNNFGSTWEKLPTEFDRIKTISNFNDKLILTTENNILYYSEDNGVSWNMFFTPIINWKVNDKHKSFYIYNQREILKLNDDLTWTRYEVNNTNQSFVFSENENGFIFAISILEPYNAKIKIYEYNISENNTTEVSEIWKIGLSDFPPFDINSYQVNDMLINNGYVYLANTFKTILKSSINDFNWKVVSNFGTINTSIVIKDSLNWTIPTGMKNCITYTTNGGVTFEISDTIVMDVKSSFADTLRKIYPSVSWMIYGEDKTLLQFLGSGYDLHNPGSTQSLSEIFALYDDINKTVEPLNIRLRLNQQGTIGQSFRMYCSYNDYFLVGFAYKIRTTSQNLPKRDSIYGHRLFFLNKDKSLDTLGRIQDSIQFPRTYVDDKNDLYVFGKRTYFDSEYQIDKIGIYKFNQQTKDFDFIMSAPSYDSHSRVIMFQNKKSEYFITAMDKIYKIDLINKVYEEVDVKIDFLTSQSPYLINAYYIEDQKMIDYYIYGESGSENFDIRILQFDSNMNYEVKGEYSEMLRHSFVYPSHINIDYELLLINNAYYFKYLKPIEPERLTYYTSVEKVETRNYLWTEPPYPHPTNGIIKVETYWDSALPFTEKDIEIYDLTGVKINTENTLSVQKEKAYKGHIIWDVSNHRPGVYIMKISHGTEVRTRKIMVVE